MHSLQITEIFEICLLFKQGQVGLSVILLPDLTDAVQHHHFNRWISVFIVQLVYSVEIMDDYWGPHSHCSLCASADLLESTR